MHLVDFPALAYKFISSTTLVNSNGDQITIKHNTTNFIQRHPQSIFCLDGEDNERKQLSSSYKANRVEAHPKFYDDYNRTIEFLQGLNYLVLEFKGYEAGDIIYTLCQNSPTEPFIIHTTDDDLLGCLAVNQNVNIYLGEKVYTLEVFLKEYGFHPCRFSDYKSLIGDTLDNVPKIGKTGDRRAKSLIKKYSHEELIGKYGDPFQLNSSLLSLRTIPGGL
jgi:5'-3' exonuclease